MERKEKTIGHFELTESKATISWEGKSRIEPFVKRHDDTETVLPQDCIMVGKTLDDIGADNEDDIIKMLEKEFPEAFYD